MPTQWSTLDDFPQIFDGGRAETLVWSSVADGSVAAIGITELLIGTAPRHTAWTTREAP